MKKLKKVRKSLPLIIALFAVIALSSLGFLIYSLKGNYVNYNNVDTKADYVSSAVAKDSNIILMNGIVLGASKENKWISADRFYEENIGINALDVNVFSMTDTYGTYKTATLKRYREKVIFTTIDKATLPNEYLAVSSNVAKNLSNLKQQEATNEDIEYVKEALAGYRMLNSGIYITEVYTSKIKNNGDKVICVIAKKAGLLGVYSAVVYVSNNKATLVKYSSAKDTDNADRWPIYTLKYVHDLNGDGVSELILEELTETDVRYTVQELRNNGEFYQVLSVSVPL